MNVPARVRWLWLTLVIVVLDRATKAWFETQTVEGWRHQVVAKFIYLVHSQNPGVAFGVLADSASVWTRVALIAGSVVVIAILAWMLVASHTDRIMHGGVTDFLEVWLGSYRWPAFNVADSAIAIGAALLIIDVLFGSRHPSA
jgi:signal peptidase II